MAKHHKKLRALVISGLLLSGCQLAHGTLPVETPLVGWEELAAGQLFAQVPLRPHPESSLDDEPMHQGRGLAEPVVVTAESRTPKVVRSYGWDAAEVEPAIISAVAATPPEELPVWTLEKTLTDLTQYQKGYLGRLGTAKVYVASRSRVPDQTRLYWVIVKVLSEKYGCFMTKQAKADEKVVSYCRDGRIIVTWRSLADDTAQFLSRQYDREGYEIVVKRRKVYRVSQSPTLTFL